MDVGQAVVATTEAVGQPLMVDAQKVKQGGVQVVDFDGILGGFVTVFVGRSIGHATSNTTASHPKTEAVRIVVPTVAPLGEGGSTKFARPENHGFIQEASRLEVCQQPGNWLIDGSGVDRVVVAQIPMGVPTGIAVGAGARQFDEADSALDETSSDQALSAVGAGVFRRGVQSIEASGGIRFTVDGRRLGHRHLHPEGQFGVGDGRLERVVFAQSRE